jgi:hypothetical protein
VNTDVDVIAVVPDVGGKTSAMLALPPDGAAPPSPLKITPVGAAAAWFIARNVTPLGTEE